MRSITFDESTVLREYARIMGEQLIKTAASDKPASKVYDVTGESGEDLVDDAHPGNMHTEISNRKDDDGNLVETIVERQEMDLDVVRKVPKGTYATLVELYNRLHKAGQVEVLSDLANVIKSIATAEDVMEHTLVTLATVLDEKGFSKAADKVDALLKTAFSAMEPAKQVIKQLIAELKQQNANNPAMQSLYKKMLTELDPVQDARGIYDYVKRNNAALAKHQDYAKALMFLQKFISKGSVSDSETLVALANDLDERGFVEAANKVDEIIKNAGSWNAGGSDMSNLNPSTPADVSGASYPEGGVHDPDAMMSYQQSTPSAAGIAGVGPIPLEPIPAGTKQDPGKVALHFQQQYNQLMGSKVLVEDSTWGPHTNSAFTGIGGWKGLHQKSQEKGMVQPAVAPGTIPPPPPPSPMAPGGTPLAPPMAPFGAVMSPATWGAGKSPTVK
jgi:hypothetical protein